MPGAMAGDVDTAEIDDCVEALVEAVVERRPPRVACLVVVLFGLAFEVLGIMIINTTSVPNRAGWNAPVTKHDLSETELAEWSLCP